MNLLLRPAAWFSSAKHQGQFITQQRRPIPATPKESDDDELVVVFAIQRRNPQ